MAKNIWLRPVLSEQQMTIWTRGGQVWHHLVYYSHLVTKQLTLSSPGRSNGLLEHVTCFLAIISIIHAIAISVHVKFVVNLLFIDS